MRTKWIGMEQPTKNRNGEDSIQKLAQGIQVLGQTMIKVGKELVKQTKPH